jgi:hypothetical protein
MGGALARLLALTPNPLKMLESPGLVIPGILTDEAAMLE